MRRRLTLLLVGLSGLVLLLVAAAVAVPILFRDRLDTLLKARINAAIDADVDWQALHLSLVRGFPHLGVTARQVRVCNRAPFQGRCLAQIDEVSARLGLLGLLRETIDVRTITVRVPRVQLDIREDGVANWHITRPDPTRETPAPSRFRIALRDYRLEDAHIVYTNRAAAVYWELVGLDHHGRGDFSRSAVDLETTTHADGASVRVDGMSYLRDARLDADVALQVDVPAGRVTLRENRIQINDLTLGIDGSIARTDTGLALDLRWASRTDDLRSLVSLLPTRLVGDLDGLETAGTVAVSGRAAGSYGKNAVPAVDMRVAVANGRFKYGALPAGIDEIALDATITSQPARDWDALALDVSRFSARLAGQPIEGRLRLATMVSDPALDAVVRANLDLADLPRVVPFTPGDTLAGHAQADVRLSGRLSALQTSRAPRFAAEGYVNLRDVLYQRRASARGVRAAALSLTFNPRHVQLLAEGAGLGETEVTIRGRFEDYLSWWLADDILKGSFEVSGGSIDLADLLRHDDPATGSAEAGAPTPQIVAIPKTVDVTIAAAARRVSYGPIELGGVRGSLRLHDRRADLRDVGFGLFGGSVTVNGSYDTRAPGRPAVALSYEAKTIDIQQAARQSDVLRAAAPVALAAMGTFNSSLEMTGVLTPSLALDLASLTGRGTVSSTNMRLDQFAPLVALARSLRIGHLENATLGDVRFTFVLREGRMVTSPFDVQVGDVSLRVGGSTTFSGQAIDYDLTGRIPTAVFGAAAQERVTEWLGPLAAGGVPAILGMTARVTGTVTQPSVALKVDAGTALTAVRGAAMAKARAEADRLLAEAEGQAADLRREAEEAAGRLRAEANEATERLQAGADTPLKRAAARLAGARLRQEASARADQLVGAANARAAALIEAARRAGADQIETAAPQ